MNEPHGGKLIDRFVAKSKLDLGNVDLELILDEDQVSEVKNISTGLYSPLTGYMNSDDFHSVVEKMKLSNGLPWSIPVFLPLEEEDFKKVKTGSQILLKLTDGEEIGVLMVEEKFEFDRENYCKNVYGTNDINHPGVARINSLPNKTVGGEIFTFGEFPMLYPKYEQTPAETRKVFEEKGWKTIVGFQTRNPAHKGHEFIQKMCLEFVDGLFVNPIIGKKKAGDFKDEVILAVYEKITSLFYPKDTTHLAVYKSRMNYAGPREAVFHSIVRKNFGCTHFIVGRDHAGVGDYYDKLAAHRIFDSIENLGIQIMRVSNAFYDANAGTFTTEKVSVPENVDMIAPSGTKVRQLVLEKNYEPLKHFMRPEMLEVISQFEQPFVE